MYTGATVNSAVFMCMLPSGTDDWLAVVRGGRRLPVTHARCARVCVWFKDGPSSSQ